VRITGAPATLDLAVDAVRSAKAVAGDRVVTGFTWADVDRAASATGTGLSRALIERASALQDTYGCIQAVSPLPTVLHAFRPTTGYEDVKAVAIARLAAPNIPTIQVDWSRYGPKLAQVALTFGADDLDAVTASDEAPDGRRRAPIEEVRRNIEAAGFIPAERDGRFSILA
jgi:2-iminoacetate synthase ThiH